MFSSLLSPGVNTMAGTTLKKSTKVVKKAAAKRVAAKPTLLAGGNPPSLLAWHPVPALACRFTLLTQISHKRRVEKNEE